MTLEQLLYLCTVVGWSSVGFLAGLVFADARRELGRIAASVAPREETVVEPSPEQPREQADPARMSRRRRVFRTVVVVLIVLSVVSSFVLEYRIRSLIESTRHQVDVNAQNDARDREIQRCLSAYAGGFAEALEARSKSSSEASAALDEWMTVLNDLLINTRPVPAEQAQARERFREATADYLEKREKAKKQQQANPYPPSPREC